MNVTEETIEDFIRLGIKAYRKNSGDCLEARKLYRHEPVEIEGREFTCWREYVVYKMGQYIYTILPKSRVEVELDGNDSTLSVELDSDEDEAILNNNMNVILNRYEKVLNWRNYGKR